MFESVLSLDDDNRKSITVIGINKLTWKINPHYIGKLQKSLRHSRAHQQQSYYICATNGKTSSPRYLKRISASEGGKAADKTWN